jgi:hypothetical protein
MDRCIFVVATTTNPDNARPLSYTNVRSVFTTDQRLAQLYESVASIKKYAAGATIVVADNSESIPAGMADGLTKAGADLFIRCFEPANTHSGNKANGESATMLAVLHALRGAAGSLAWPGSVDAKSGPTALFKLSGRYVLTDEFRPDYYLTNAANGKICAWSPAGMDVMTTVLYSVPRQLAAEYETALRGIGRGPYAGNANEWQMRRALEPYLVHTLPLGCAGFVSVDGSYFRR